MYELEGFEVLSNCDVIEINGGSALSEFCKGVIGVVVGAAAEKGASALGAKVGGTVGTFIGGPVGGLVVGGIGAVAGYVVAGFIIMD